MAENWSNEDALILIGHYEKHPVLWNPKDTYYYNKIRKLDAWTAISKAMNKCAI